MKNLSLGLNLVLLVAVAVLYFLHFSKKSEDVVGETSTQEPTSDYTIAYINTDSVLINYDYFDELQVKLKDKSEKLQADYQNRATSLQNEFNDYQKNGGNLTIAQAKAVEENLVKKQQNLRVYQESLTQELLKERSKTDQELYDLLTKFLADYGKENDLQMVVQYGQSSDVLYATEGMDITKAVTDGLNSQYKNVGISSDSTSVPVDTTGLN